MNEALQQQLLAQLRDIQLPEPVSWWPLAPGWWFVIASCLAILIGVVLMVVRHQKRNRYRRLAMNELEESLQRWHNNTSDSAYSNGDYIEKANDVLRRTVKHVSHDSSLTSQSGQQWADTLQSFSKKHTLSENSRFALTEACYHAEPDVDIDELHQQLCQWLQSHKATQVIANGGKHA